MGLNLENRQRVIFVSNAKEEWASETDSLKTLSTQFPNVVFFTDDYDKEHIYSDGHRVNIWKAGQKYIKVHGLSSNRSVTIGGELIISLTLSENGLLGLAIGSTIKNIVVLGVVPFNNNWSEIPGATKPSSFAQAHESYPETISGLLKDGTGYCKGANGKYYVSSNVNKMALYLAVQCDKLGHLLSELCFVNRNDLTDEPSHLSAADAFRGDDKILASKEITSLGELKVDLGLAQTANDTGTPDVKVLLDYSDEDIVNMLENSITVTPFNPATTEDPNYVICRYDIDFNKIFESAKGLQMFPISLSVDEVTYGLKNTNESWNDVTRNGSFITNIQLEPFFNVLDVSSSNTGNDGIKDVKTTKLTIKPNILTTSISNPQYRFDENFAKYYGLYSNYNGLTVKAFIDNNGALGPEININDLNEIYKKTYRELVDPTDTTHISCISFGNITAPTQAKPYYEVDVTVSKLCDEVIKRYIEEKNYTNINRDIVTSIFLCVESNLGSNTLPVNGFSKGGRYLNSNYIYANPVHFTVTSEEFKVGIFVMPDEQDNGTVLNQSLVNLMNTSFANPNKHIINVASFVSLTSSSGSNDYGRRIVLENHTSDADASGGYTYIAIPKAFNNRLTSEQYFTNLLISNGIRYVVDTGNGGQKYAYFSVVPDEFVQNELKYDGFEYIVLKVKTPITGEILLLNNNSEQIYSNIQKKWLLQ